MCLPSGLRGNVRNHRRNLKRRKNKKQKKKKKKKKKVIWNEHSGQWPSQRGLYYFNRWTLLQSLQWSSVSSWLDSSFFTQLLFALPLLRQRLGVTGDGWSRCCLIHWRHREHVCKFQPFSSSLLRLLYTRGTTIPIGIPQFFINTSKIAKIISNSVSKMLQNRSKLASIESLWIQNPRESQRIPKNLLHSTQ